MDYSVLNKLYTPILAIDRNYNIVFLNDAAKNAYGYQPDKGGVFGKCYHVSHGYNTPCQEKGESCPISKLKLDDSKLISTESHYHKNAFYKIEACRNIDNKNLFFEFHTEITDFETRIHFLKKEIKEISVFKDFFYDNSFPMFLFDPKNLEIIDVNESAIGFYGYSREELAGKKIYETINPELDKELILSNVEMALRKEKRVFTGLKHKLKNGTYRNIQSNLTPIRVSTNKIVVLAAIVDVTDRLLAEKNIKESERQYRTMTEVMLEGICIFRKNIIYSNYAATNILGYSKNELCNMQLWQLFTDKDRERIKNITLGISKGGKFETSMTIKAIAKNGKELWLLVHGMTIKYSGKWTGFITFTDITEKINYEEGLIKKQVELEEQKNKAEIINDYYSALATANGFMIKVHEKKVIFKEICRIISGINEITFAWIGLWNGVRVEPVAFHSNIESGDKIFAKFMGDNPFVVNSGYPTITMEAFNTKKPIIVNDFINSGYAVKPYREYMKELSSNALAAFPIHQADRNVGVLTVYAGTNAFNSKSESLLKTLADNISSKMYLVALEEKEKENKKIIEHLAYHDILTGIPNRTNFLNRIKSVLSRSRRHHTPVALVLLDMDGFKDINDKYGHETGDKFLIKVSKRFKRSLREEDELFRIGGDEFTIIVETFNSKDDLLKLCSRIIENINRPFIIDNNKISAGVSIGIALSLKGRTGMEEILRIADSAMYEAKSAGKNRCVIKSAWNKMVYSN